jgi:hypothetical protein
MNAFFLVVAVAQVVYLPLLLRRPKRIVLYKPLQ